jgi:hypothetical protein
MFNLIILVEIVRCLCNKLKKKKSNSAQNAKNSIDTQTDPSFSSSSSFTDNSDMQLIERKLEQLLEAKLRESTENANRNNLNIENYGSITTPSMSHTSTSSSTTQLNDFNTIKEEQQKAAAAAVVSSTIAVVAAVSLAAASASCNQLAAHQKEET